tara:strand:+ start:441 stop:872 length:432 start_codon:yes stop_codon:yes gene_type:complete
MPISKNELRKMIQEALNEVFGGYSSGGHPSSNVRGSTWGSGDKKSRIPRLTDLKALEKPVQLALVVGLVELERKMSYMPKNVTPQQFAAAIDARALSRGIFPNFIEEAKEVILAVEKTDLPMLIKSIKELDPDYYKKFSPLRR